MSIIAVSIAHFINNTELKKMILLGIPLLQFMPLFLAGTIFYKLQNNQTNKYVAYFTLLSCFILQLMLFEHVGASRIFINKWEYFLALGSYFIIFFLAVRNRLKFIINPISLFLGKISFALYLIHFNISRKLLLPLFHEKLDINFFVASIITIFIVVGFASCITYMVEIPMQKKLKAKLSCLIIK
jgi:peptidoglycan/LPS O-acetylase OafA/YrhL